MYCKLIFKKSICKNNSLLILIIKRNTKFLLQINIEKMKKMREYFKYNHKSVTVIKNANISNA